MQSGGIQLQSGTRNQAPSRRCQRNVASGRRQWNVIAGFPVALQFLAAAHGDFQRGTSMKKPAAFRIKKSEAKRYWRDFIKGKLATGGEIGGYIFARQQLDKRRNAAKQNRKKK
jgi:hypothetical protein